MTPLMYACQKSDFEAVKFLIDNGANLDDEDMYEESVLSYAIASGNIDIVEYIINKGNLKIPRYSLTIAAISGNLSLVHYIHQRLGNKKENVFSSAFVSAAHNGFLDIVRYFFADSKKEAPKAMANVSSVRSKK